MIIDKNDSVYRDGYDYSFPLPPNHLKRVFYNINNLEGTEKQIDYAKSIIFGHISKFLNCPENSGLKKVTEEQMQVAISNLLKVVEGIEKYTDAKWIIENNTNFGRFVCEMIKEKPSDDELRIQQQKIDDQLKKIGYKPQFPSEFEALRNGSRWNGTVYGKPGKYNVYFNNKKFEISDELKDEVDKVSAALKEWETAKEKIINNK